MPNWTSLQISSFLRSRDKYDQCTDFLEQIDFMEAFLQGPIVQSLRFYINLNDTFLINLTVIHVNKWKGVTVSLNWQIFHWFLSFQQQPKDNQNNKCFMFLKRMQGLSFFTILMNAVNEFTQNGWSQSDGRPIAFIKHENLYKKNTKRKIDILSW